MKIKLFIKCLLLITFLLLLVSFYNIYGRVAIIPVTAVSMFIYFLAVSYIRVYLGEASGKMTPKKMIAGVAVILLITIVFLLSQISLYNMYGSVAFLPTTVAFLCIYLLVRVSLILYVGEKSRAMVSKIFQTISVIVISVITLIVLMFFIPYFINMFGWKAVALILISGTVGTVITSGGYVFVAILCILPLTYVSHFLGIVPSIYISYFLTFIMIPVLVFLFRKQKILVHWFVRFVFFVCLGCFTYSAVWYCWPGMTHPLDVENQPGIKHLTAPEKYVLKLQHPRSIYSITEDCSGDALYMTNMFNYPGLLRWKRGSDYVEAHPQMRSSTEHMVFDCADKKIYAAELKTGRLIVFNGIDINSPVTFFPNKIHKPCSIYHNPSSDMVFYLADEFRAPLYIFDTNGNKLFKFNIGQVEEYALLPDDSFVGSDGKKLYHLRFDKKLHLVSSIIVKNMPDKNASRMGPLYQHLVYDKIKQAVFISDFNTGKIYRADFPEFEVRELAKLDKGLRNLVVSDNYNCIVVSNYLKGILSFIDKDTGSVKYSIKLGSRLRGVSVSRDGERIYTISRGGMFEITMKTVMKQ